MMHHLNVHIEKHRDYGPLCARIGIGIVFMLFGYQKISLPETTALEMKSILESVPVLSAFAPWSAQLNILMGIAELASAFGLILGLYTRYAALLGSLIVSIIIITFTVAANFSLGPLIWRDIGILGGVIGIFLTGPGRFSVDHRISGYPITRH